MIILRSPEDGPWERRPGGGEQAPVRAPVRRAPGARGAPCPSDPPGFWDHAQVRARPLGPRRRENSGSRTGWGAARAAPPWVCKNCVRSAPPSAVGALRSACGSRAERARSARTERVLTPERERSARGMCTECVRAPECVRSAYEHPGDHPQES